MSEVQTILLISHAGFILWFYAGYRLGKTKSKTNKLK